MPKRWSWTFPGSMTFSTETRNIAWRVGSANLCISSVSQIVTMCILKGCSHRGGTEITRWEWHLGVICLARKSLSLTWCAVDTRHWWFRCRKMSREFWSKVTQFTRPVPERKSQRRLTLGPYKFVREEILFWCCLWTSFYPVLGCLEKLMLLDKLRCVPWIYCNQTHILPMSIDFPPALWLFL